MTVYISTRGKPTLSLGICGRCGRKTPSGELRSDPNRPGLLVCLSDLDVLDPYRLPARQVENITLPFVRPDEGVATNPAGVIAENGDEFLISEDSEEYWKP